MKRILASILCILLLAGCGAKEAGEMPEPQQVPPAEETALEKSNVQPEADTGSYVLSTEWTEYDPSVETVWFTLEEAPEDGSGADVTFTENGPDSLEPVSVFLEKVRLGIPCQLRTAQVYSESWPMVIDVLYENDHFLWRMGTGGEIAEERFSYIVTDGTDIYLSNGADWPTAEKFMNKELTWLIPEGWGGKFVETVEDMTSDRLAGNSARYRVWSADGCYDAMLTETPTEFGVGWQKPGEGSWGQMFDIQDWDGLETAVHSLDWQADGKLLLVCGTSDGGASRLLFDPETKRLQTELCGLPPAK